MKRKKKPECAICGKSRSAVPKGIPTSKRRLCWRTKSMDWCGDAALPSGYRMFQAYPRESK